MGKRAFTTTKQGLLEAIDYAHENIKRVKIHKFKKMDVKAIRDRTGMTQSEFATTFGISLGTLRHWERGDRAPQGPALVLLNLVARKPSVIRTILISDLAA